MRKDKPEEWKCQPYNWLPRDLEIHEMVVGAFSLAIGSFISAAAACWVMNDGYSKIYFDPAEHGYFWLVIQLPVVFIWQVRDPFFSSFPYLGMPKFIPGLHYLLGSQNFPLAFFV